MRPEARPVGPGCLRCNCGAVTRPRWPTSTAARHDRQGAHVLQGQSARRGWAGRAAGLMTCGAEGLDLGLRRISLRRSSRRCLARAAASATRPGRQRSARRFAADELCAASLPRRCRLLGDGSTRCARQRAAAQRVRGLPRAAVGGGLRVGAFSRRARAGMRRAGLPGPGAGCRGVLRGADAKGSAQSSEVFSTARNADWGSSTSPTIFMRFLPSFCFSRSLRLREMSPP